MGSNPSDKYLNTKTPKCLNKSILDASGKNGITFSKKRRYGDKEKRRKGKYLKSKIPKYLNKTKGIKPFLRSGDGEIRYAADTYYVNTEDMLR
jgi:hypothetical protein